MSVNGVNHKVSKNPDGTYSIFTEKHVCWGWQLHRINVDGTWEWVSKQAAYSVLKTLNK